ncbi:MAG: polysaccharide biosynthesis/export family protein [Candidatus Korobacteraceae bacterium]
MTREKQTLGFALVIVLLLVSGRGIALGQGAQASAPGASNSSDAPTPAPEAMGPDYVIGLGDVLNINVWKEPEVSSSVPVRPDGKISLPLVNDIQAASLTPMQLGDSIRSKLEKYIAAPQVTVVVTSVNSRMVYLVGEVGRPGSFSLLPNMTLLQALSAAGGVSQFADSKKIYVLRNENGKPRRIPFNYKEALQGLHPEQNIELVPGDTIVVP